MEGSKQKMQASKFIDRRHRAELKRLIIVAVNIGTYAECIDL